MATFAERLKLLRTERELTRLALSKLTGISHSSINMYERGEREPGLETLEIIADYFNVDMDYLLGRQDTLRRIDFSSLDTVAEKTEHPSILSQVKKEYSENAATALSLYVQLDEIDQGKITERMTVLLEDEKYSSKTKNGASPA
jgi:transcriptional regulator with XRE-family HTH domain